MRVTLAVTWNPRGELARFLALLPVLAHVYAALAIVVPPATQEASPDEPALDVLAHTPLAQAGRLIGRPAPVWAQGRYLALKTAREFSTAHVQYADLDRLLRWAETRPAEWQQTVRRIEACEALVIGRTAAAYATHPQALVKTEALSNRLVSSFLGREMDVSAGSKAFSRRALEYLVNHARPERPLGADAEWPILLKRAGFSLDYLEVDGLDWESADRYRSSAADAAVQSEMAVLYDADPKHWAYRVAVAHEIVESALDASQRPLSSFSNL
ncbi:MAG: hypothetical protein ACOYYS_21220 [Chloroflexota bacterium]